MLLYIQCICATLWQDLTHCPSILPFLCTMYETQRRFYYYMGWSEGVRKGGREGEGWSQGGREPGREGV